MVERFHPGRCSRRVRFPGLVAEEVLRGEEGGLNWGHDQENCSHGSIVAAESSSFNTRQARLKPKLELYSTFFGVYGEN